MGGVQMCGIYNFPYMNSNNKLGLLVTVFFPITSNSWWFVTSYMLLFLMIPVLNQIILNIKGKGVWSFVFIFLFIWYMTSVFNFNYQGIQRAVFFYLIGAWMKKNQIKFCKWRAFFFFCFSWCVFVCCDMIITGNIGQGVTGKIFQISFESIEILFVFTAVISLLSFFSVIKIKSSRFINTVASTTFGIYLFHDSNVGRQLIWDEILHTLDKQYMSSLFPLFAVVSVIMVFTCATMIDLIRQKYFEKRLLPILESKINKFFRKQI